MINCPHCGKHLYKPITKGDVMDDKLKEAVERKNDYRVFREMTDREKRLTETPYQDGVVEWHKAYHANSERLECDLKGERRYREHCYLINKLQTAAFVVGAIALIGIAVALFTG